jgi:hypothetical protein
MYVTHKKFSSYLTHNTAHLHYKKSQSIFSGEITAVYGETHQNKYTLRQEAAFMLQQVVYTFTNGL